MNYLQAIRSIFILLGLILLTSCVTQKTKPWNTQSATTFMHTDWQEQGVLSYREGKKGFSSSYIWQNKSNQYTIQIIAPLGAWRANLQVTPNETSLKTSDGKAFYANNPAMLMEENLNWSIPVTNLRYWLLGIPMPDEPFSMRKNAQDDIAHLNQAGWSIDYSDYKNFSIARLPEKIVLSQGEKKITLVVQNFKTGNA